MIKLREIIFPDRQARDPLRYIIPTNPAGYESGWKFNVNRDYLLPIQTRMLGDLTGGMWEQNPGW